MAAGAGAHRQAARVKHEIVFFHAHDPAPALNFGDTSAETMFDVCVRSIRARSPSRMTLLTNLHTELGKNHADVERTVDASLDTRVLIYEKARLYTEHLARRVAEGADACITFLDIDIIVTRDLSEAFAADFDVGLTVRIPEGITLDANHLPHNTPTSPINAGVIFCRPTKPALAFMQEMLRVFNRLHEEGAVPASAMVPDMKKWGGEQYAMMNMVGRELVEKRPETLRYGETLVRFFDCDTYNFTPQIGVQLSAEELAPKYVLHMKGPRKHTMPSLAQWLGIP